MGKKNLKKTEHLQDQDADGKIMLKYILEEMDGNTWTCSIGQGGKEQIMCYCEIGSKISGSAKRGEFLDQF